MPLTPVCDRWRLRRAGCTRRRRFIGYCPRCFVGRFNYRFGYFAAQRRITRRRAIRQIGGRRRGQGEHAAGLRGAAGFRIIAATAGRRGVGGTSTYLRRSDRRWSALGRIIAARARRVFDRAGQRSSQRTLRIGVSARIFHPKPGAPGLRGKTLQYVEESIAHRVMSRDVLVFMIPTVGHQGTLHPSNIRLRDYAKHLNGLLQGGADVSPQTYAASDARPEWPGDRVHDMYALECCTSS
ncbi:hypothetical protein OKW42_008115 [Paraburkholderia sp. WC7.3d]